MPSKTLSQNTILFTLALALQKLISFGYFIIIARSIGVENTGRFSFALSFAAVFAMFLDFGLNQALIRESARDQETSQKNLANVVGFKMIGSVVIYGVLFFLVNLLDYPDLTKQLVYVAGLVMLIDSFALSFFSVLRGRHNLMYESVCVVANQILVVVFGLLAIYFNLGLTALISAYVFGSAFNFFFTARVLKKKYRVVPRAALNKEALRKILKIALPFGLAGIFIRIYSSMDMILLSKLTDDASMGLYSVAFKITFALQFIGVAFSAGVYPAFCSYFVHSKERLGRTFVKAVRYLLIISLPLSFGLISLADKAIGPIFGKEYIPAIPALNVLMASLVLIFLCFPVGAILNACDRQSRNTIHLGVVAVSNIILNLILIPLFGFAGAAWASLLSYVLLFGLGIVVVEKTISYDKKVLFVSLIKILFACVIMTLAVLGLKDSVHFIFVIPFGVLTYFSVLFLLKEFTFKDLIQLKKMAGKAEEI